MLIQLAGLTIDVETRSPYVRSICLPYAAPEGATADFSVCVDIADLQREAILDAEEVRHTARTAATPDILESAALYRKICHAALQHDVFLFHGSALALDGVGYLFTAPSGTGKSTHAALWHRVFGDRVITVNDDKPLLRVTDTGVQVCGTPWDGKHHLSTPGCFPLTSVCFLERGEENALVPLTLHEAYPHLLGQTYRPNDSVLLAKTLSLLDRAVTHLSFYKLICNMSPEAALTACRGMGGMI